MYNINYARDFASVLPSHLEDLLDEDDQRLNRLPSNQLLRAYEAQECKVYVDQFLALSAARAGFPVSRLATICSLVFPLLLLTAIASFFVWGWQVSALAVLCAVIAFRASRYFTVKDVRNAALSDEKKLVFLMSKGVVWFEVADR